MIIGHKKKHFDLHFHFFCIKHFNSVHCEQLSQLLWQKLDQVPGDLLHTAKLQIVRSVCLEKLHFPIKALSRILIDIPKQ